MMTRQKIKMEDSFHQVQTNLPYFSNEEATYSSKYAKNSQHLAQPPIGKSQHAKYASFRTDMSEEQARPHAARNQILKELRQQYEILRNLSIEQSMHVPIRKDEPHYQKLQEKQSQLSSSLVSKENKAKQIGMYKQGNREIQSLYLQKKQLELVIGNSMRKIEQLLSNQISLKKTIHQLKNQIQGKGGIAMEYEKTIRNLQNSQQEMQRQVSKLKHQNQKLGQKLRQQNDKIRSLENEQEKKERELKQSAEQHRRLQQLLRIQKDKYLNLQIQCRSYKMEFEMLEKQKNNQINRLVRQFQTKQGGSQKQMAFLIKKLQEELKQKDRRYHDLLLQSQRRQERESDIIQLDKKVGDKDKNYLEEILVRNREINQYNNKALSDGMNLIFSKMAELQKKNDQNLKRQIEQLRKKTEEITSVRKNSENDRQLSSKVSQLQKIIERQAAIKEKLLVTIKELNGQKSVLEQKIQEVQKKMKEHYNRKENGLVQKFAKELEQASENYRAVENNYNTLKAQYVVLAQKLKAYQSQETDKKHAVENQSSVYREREKKLQQEVRTLKRRIDELNFQAQKNKKEGQFNLNLYKTSQQSDAKRLISQNQRVISKLREAEEKSAMALKELQNKLKAKEGEVAELKNMLQNIKMKTQNQMINQKKAYQEKISHVQARHSSEIKSFSEKFIAVTSANEKMMIQLSQIPRLQSEMMQLRRVLKISRNTSSGVDHLWQIKQTEYGNITHVLKSLRQDSYQ